MESWPAGSPDLADVVMQPGASGTMFWEGEGASAVEVEAVELERYLFWRWAEEADVAPETTVMRPCSLGTRLHANCGRQHSSRIVRWTRSTAPLVAGRPARMKSAARRAH